MLYEIGLPTRFRPSNSCLTGRHDTVSTQAILFRKWLAGRSARCTSAFLRMVGAGGDAPLVSFRHCFVTAGLQAASRISAFMEKWLQAPVMLRIVGHMKPGSRLLGLRSCWFGDDRGGRTRTCFSVLPRHCSRLFDLAAFFCSS